QPAGPRAGAAPKTINPVASAVPASNAWRDLAVLPTPIPSPVVLIERFECSIRLTPQIERHWLPSINLGEGGGFITTRRSTPIPPEHRGLPPHSPAPPPPAQPQPASAPLP